MSSQGFAVKKHSNSKHGAEARRYKNFIGGHWVDSASRQDAPNINPANTDDVIGRVPLSTRDEARAAIEAARAAYPAWRAVPAPQRGRILAKAVELCYQRKDEIAHTMTHEEGKPLGESRGEIQKSINLLEYYAGQAFRIEGCTYPSEMPQTFVYTLRQPLGVVSCITPWNFPFCVPAWKIAPALVAGNTVVFKPATNTPGCAEWLVKILDDAGVPKGVLNLIYGSGGMVGDELVNNPTVRALSFTGSCEVGARVAQQAAAHLAKVTCEMGGKNPVLVMDDADLDLAVEGVVQGAFGSTGQRCTATSRVILHQAIAEKFIGKLLERIGKIKVGDGMDDGINMGPVVDRAQFETDLRFIELAKEEGGQCLIGGTALTEGRLAKGYFVAPTVFDNVKPGQTVAQEEVFGPVLTVLRVNDFDEALQVANGVKFGHTCAIYTADANLAMKFTERIEAGMVHINQPTIGGEAQLPFGGIKATGYGHREMSEEGLNFFTELKTVFYDYTGTKRQTNIY
ncbi:MAG TPA: aldehyde dehydrogenase family protein [Verrucomicrobiae bacterium]|nr:aldehyde dehydrogenase family protein [Verrucomicrobiae bacterium]